MNTFEWLKISFNWIFVTRKQCKIVLNNQLTNNGVYIFHRHMLLNRFKDHSNHWTCRNFGQMCFQRVCLIKKERSI